MNFQATVDFEGSSSEGLATGFLGMTQVGNHQGREVTTTVQYCAAVSDIMTRLSCRLHVSAKPARKHTFSEGGSWGQPIAAAHKL